jgi:hypothetical protein
MLYDIFANPPHLAPHVALDMLLVQWISISLVAAHEKELRDGGEEKQERKLTLQEEIARRPHDRSREWREREESLRWATGQH